MSLTSLNPTQWCLAGTPGFLGIYLRNSRKCNLEFQSLTRTYRAHVESKESYADRSSAAIEQRSNFRLEGNATAEERLHVSMRVFNAQLTDSDFWRNTMYVMAKDSCLKRSKGCNYGENKGESMIDDSIANFKL